MFPGIDLDSELQRKRLLQQLPTISPDQVQDPTASPNAPVQGPTASPNYTPVQTPTPSGDYTPVPAQQPPFQNQMDQINQDISQLGKTGQNIADLQVNVPKPGPVNKLRAALLMPLQVLAGAGGVDTTAEYKNLTHPGYAQAMSDYQRKLAAQQTQYANMKDLIKDKIDALKEEGTITKDQAETLNQQAEADIKRQQLQNTIQEGKIRQQEIPPLNQGIQLARDQAAKEKREFTTADFNKVVEDYYTAQEKSRLAAEDARLKAQKAQEDAAKKLNKQEINISQDISKEQTRLDGIIKPLQNGKQALANLRALRASGDDDGFARLLTVIGADNALSAATHGTVRQNIGIIQDLIKSPGWLEYLKGKAQGILHPGKGSISDATMKQIDKIIDSTERQMDAELDPAVKNLSNLNMLDPTEPDTRGKLNEIINQQYTMPKAPKAPDVPKPADDRAAQMKKIQDQLDAIDAAIKKKLAQKN